jgi:four helix bundle protein
MFLELSHTKLDLFRVSREFVLQCYEHTKALPAEEKYGLTQQIRRASLSVHLNIAEGFSRKSQQERIRFYEIARGSLVEVDIALDIAISLNYLNKERLQKLGTLINRCFQMPSNLIRKQESNA